MNLLILNGPNSPTIGRTAFYRGTDRAHPTYCDSLPEDHEVNRYFYWFLENGGESGVVHDAKRAVHYTKLLNIQYADNVYETVEVVDDEGTPMIGGNFLGYDISLNYNSSLLSWGLQLLPSLNSLPIHARVLYKLLNRHYAPLLNNFGLFQEYEIASSCLDAMVALQAVCPNIFEGGDLGRFCVVGLFIVDKLIDCT